ncbi:DNA polymerase/helicase [Burkholderia mallei]|nr:putative DNA polymerase/helicase domain protein [Burkholderia mallei]SUW45684.1 DNA polymerase/helicase [Burkholderia mallei]
MRRNIGQPRTLLPLSRSWFKGTLLEAHWPYRRGQVIFHVIDQWRYVGAASSIERAATLAADARAAGEGARSAAPAVRRILQTHLARGLQLIPIPLAGAAPAAA